MTANSRKIQSYQKTMKENFNTKLNGKQISLYTLKNTNGIELSLTNYGARIVSCLVPSSDGDIADVVLGYDSIEGYFNSNELYFGATIGRYANRIENAKIKLGNQLIILEKNEPPNHLHGGSKGFHSVVWDVQKVEPNRVTFRHISANGEDEYPGEVQVEVSYSLNDNNEITIEYLAVSDKKTILNLTNHAYFNLSGAGSGLVANHCIEINADSFTPVNESMIPTGEFKKVDGTVFDFRAEKPIGKHWDADNTQLKYARGYDHNFVLNKNGGRKPEFSARVKDPVSGRVLEVDTTEPGIQFYTANSLDGSDTGREGVPYESRNAFCLETQHFPNSPNQPNFPSVVLEPGEKHTSTTIYRFKF